MSSGPSSSSPPTIAPASHGETGRRWRRYADHRFTGDWQLHTTVTDGRSTPTDYLQAARQRRTTFLHFSEHVRMDLQYDYDHFRSSIRQASDGVPEVTVAIGAEAKVLNTRGDLDIHRDLAESVDLILFSFHTPYFETVTDYLDAVVAATQNPLADVWAHPTSYPKRMSLEISVKDFTTMAEALAEAGVAYELNKRYGLPTLEEGYILNEHGVVMVAGSDAHDASELLSSEDRSKIAAWLGVAVNATTEICSQPDQEEHENDR